MTDSRATRPTDQTGEPLLRLEGVTAGYDRTTVLRNISFGVNDGEIIGIVGRNGAGKTTTLQTIMGNTNISAGTITYDETDITELSPEETAKHGLALVPEERRIFTDLSVRENLELAKIGGSGEEFGWDVDDALASFENLEESEHAAGSALSGGEQQMLAIARALVSDARLLLLDEVTEGLAPLIIERVVTIVEELNEQGLPILLVEQNVHVALDVCDYIYVIDNGVIVHDSPAEELRDEQETLDRYLGVTN